MSWLLLGIAGCGTLPADFDLSILTPIDLSGDWRIIPDDPDRPANCISIRDDTVTFYTTQCDAVNDLVSVNSVRAVNASTLFIDISALDGSGGVGRIEILATVVDADTLDGRVRVSNAALGRSEIIEMTMIR